MGNEDAHRNAPGLLQILRFLAEDAQLDTLSEWVEK
jgi:hypothetical protein